MNDQVVVEIGLNAMITAAQLAAPMLLTALIVGFMISLFQSVTQIQEVTLTFVPKAVAVGVALILAGSWMVHTIVSFTQDLYSRIPGFL